MSEMEVFSAAAPPIHRYANPLRPWRALWQHRGLIRQLARRDLIQRYRSSLLGMVWTFLLPLLHLAVYTFIFNIVLRVQWSHGPGGGTGRFAMALFCGLILYSVFSESVIVSPMLIVTKASYVRKMVFPLEVLPVVSLVQVLVKAGTSLIILAAGTLLLDRKLPWTFALVWLPFVPMILYTLGVAWFLAAMGVFIRDIAQVIAIPVQLLFFLSGIVHPISRVPERFRPLMLLNPIAQLVEAVRRLALWGLMPDWIALAGVFLGGLVVFQLGYLFFMKSRRAFADVL